jgi:hypothetical protein
MYLAHHSSLKTEAIDAVTGGRELLTTTFGHKAMCIFVAGDKSPQCLGRGSEEKP